MSKVLPLSRWDKSEQFAREEFSDPELDEEEEEEAYAFDHTFPKTYPIKKKRGISLVDGQKSNKKKKKKKKKKGQPKFPTIPKINPRERKRSSPPAASPLPRPLKRRKIPKVSKIRMIHHSFIFAKIKGEDYLVKYSDSSKTSSKDQLIRSFHSHLSLATPLPFVGQFHEKTGGTKFRRSNMFLKF